MELAFENAADEVLLALTHGPTPGVQDWEILESGLNEDETSAWARIQVRGTGQVRGTVFLLSVEEEQ